MTHPTLSQAKLIVVKVGSSLVTAEGRGIDQTALDNWATQIAAIKRSGTNVILVSSGAIAEGVKRLGWAKRPTALNELQAQHRANPAHARRFKRPHALSQRPQHAANAAGAEYRARD